MFSDLSEEDIDDHSLSFSFGGKKVIKKVLKSIRVSKHG